MLYLHQEEIANEARKVLYQHGYDDLRPIGDGGFATIYRVRSRKYQQDFVVKLIDLTLDEYSQILPASFQAEIDALTRLDHTNVIRIFDHFVTQSLLYIILEYCPGGSLKDYITKNGCIPAPLIFNWCRQILLALHFCHQNGIAHRDIKPSNILIDNYKRTKLADFGLAQLYQSSIISPDKKDEKSKKQLSNVFGGSLPYLAPEILSEKLYDPFKADVWSLGVTFFEMACGSLPYDPPGGISPETLLEMINQPNYSPLTKIKNMHPDFVKAVKMMLTIDPNNRCSLQAVMSFQIFLKEKTSFVKLAPTVLSKESNNFQRRNVKSLSASGRGSVGRSSCIYSAKRPFQMQSLVQTFQSENDKKTDDDDVYQYWKS